MSIPDPTWTEFFYVLVVSALGRSLWNFASYQIRKYMRLNDNGLRNRNGTYRERTVRVWEVKHQGSNRAVKTGRDWL